MFHRCGLALAALALFSLAGGQWGVAQSVAWVSMLRDYAKETGSIAQAVSETFDGEHPCELCKQIAMAKADEKKAPELSLLAKRAKAEKGAPVAGDGLSLTRPPVADVTWVQMNSSSWMPRFERPPSPPPRA